MPCQRVACGLKAKVDYLLDVMEGSVHKETDVYFHRTQRSSHCIVYSPEKDEVVALFLDLPRRFVPIGL